MHVSLFTIYSKRLIITYLSQVVSTSYELLSDSLKMHHIPYLLLYYKSVSEYVRILPAAIDRYDEWSQRGIQCCGGSGPPAGKVYQRRSVIIHRRRVSVSVRVYDVDVRP